MTCTITLEQTFYRDFSKNIKILEATRKRINSQINDALRKDDDYSVKLYTNIYMILYSS